ncbi:hypothetical protein ANOM_003845 [Aspergillus nomiae NRRL 13137]|uniref:Uncharacterized protein n=1 Tax=Aspergillus nomiae NRRL (strain ATCC 15546 / NRRL 13137 / CBS 260.88 / M93) TaxID=1509407 RepID=A0A0L1J587_ASPN3|nr:uncharacterized protein ANOM_003845 [Aspergillus nomiae NRRL 13137]KNG86578.1 hypothetical protein ANOM_003845 [Aspergillus nomiae NRRL 13137]
MDLLSKFGHLSKEQKRRKSTSSNEESKDDEDHTPQRAFNFLLGNFGRSHNDHPDRRSSGAGNMAKDIDEWRRSKKKSAPSQEAASDLRPEEGVSDLRPQEGVSDLRSQEGVSDLRSQ